MAVAARTMRTTSTACTKLIRANRLAARVSGTLPRATAARHRINANHGSDLEQQNCGEQAHLGPEEAVVEVIEAAFLVPAERPDQARADPQQRGQAPPVIGVKHAPQSRNVELRLEPATTSPHGAKAHAQREQMKCSQQPSDRHGQYE